MDRDKPYVVTIEFAGKVEIRGYATDRDDARARALRKFSEDVDNRIAADVTILSTTIDIPFTEGTGFSG